MHGRPKLGKERMVTVATRVEPSEVQKLKSLADECGMSLCGYMRELVRTELCRADRTKSDNPGDLRNLSVQSGHAGKVAA